MILSLIILSLIFILMILAFFILSKEDKKTPFEEEEIRPIRPQAISEKKALKLYNMTKAYAKVPTIEL